MTDQHQSVSTGDPADVPAQAEDGPDAAGTDGSTSAGADQVDVLHGAQTARIRAWADALATVVDLAGPAIDEAEAEAVRAGLARVKERLELGVDRTVVAILGGTGSGKSSLFNAVTRLQFADVGDTRPTTSRAAACVWGPDGAALLDWMGVHPHRRIQRESALDGADEANLAGLVLLDLPDHDSIEAGHRDVVDQVLPFSDLVIWVVDPQKYADDALHSGYLSALDGRETTTLVVFNQIDTVPANQRKALVLDLERLLVEDGLTGVEVLAVSARTGDGIAALRERLVGVVGQQSSAAAHAQDEVEAAAKRLLAALGPTVRLPEPGDLDEPVETLLRAAGLEAAAAAAGSALRGGAGLPATFGSVHEEGAELARSQWIDRTTSGLPPRWTQEVRDRVATPAELRQAVGDALTGLTIGAQAPRLVTLSPMIGGGLGLLGLAGLIRGLLPDGLSAAMATAGLVLLLVGAAVVAAGWWWRRVLAVRASARVLQTGRTVVRAAAEVRLMDPTRDVISRLAALQSRAAAAGD